MLEKARALEKVGVYGILIIFLVFGNQVYKDSRNDADRIDSRLVAIEVALVTVRESQYEKQEALALVQERTRSMSWTMEDIKENMLRHIYTNQTYVVLEASTVNGKKQIKLPLLADEGT